MTMQSATVRASIDVREALRRETSVPATLREGVQPLDAVIVDISAAGFRARCEVPIAVGTEVTIGAVGIGLVHAETIWARGQQNGFRFKTALSAGSVETIRAADNVRVLQITPLSAERSLPAADLPLQEHQPGICGIFRSIGLASAASMAALFRFHQVSD